MWLTYVSTGKRRYGHPALNGVLPQPWLPLKQGQSIRNGVHSGLGPTPDTTPAVVLTLRKRHSIMRPRSEIARIRPVDADSTRSLPDTRAEEAIANPWHDTTPRPNATRHQSLQHRLSFDQPSGVIMLPDEEWLGEESDSDEDYIPEVGNEAINERVSHGSLTEGGPHSPSSSKRYGTYYHHPERRKRP